MCITGICHDKYLTGLLRYGSIYTLGRNWLLTKPHRWKNFAAVSDINPENTAANADKSTEVQNLNFKKFNNYTSGSPETEPQEVQNTDLQKFKKQTSRSSETELAEVQKTDPNYTDYNYTDYSQTEKNQTNNNYTDMSYTNPINQSVGSMDSAGSQEKDGMMDGIDTIDETNAYMALIRKNLEYEHHMKYDQYGDKEMYEEIYETVCDVVCVKRKTIRINGEDYPYELVKSRFLKLDSSHVEYVMGCMKGTVTKITNIRAYLITALYNAPSTMNHYYQQEVQHDMYGGGWAEKGIT